MTAPKWNSGAATTEAPRAEYIRPRGKHQAWKGDAPAILPNGGPNKPRRAVLEVAAREKAWSRALEVAAREKAWSRARTETNRRLRYGDPDAKPPALVKPPSPASYGECPDDVDVPWHKRTKAQR